jgi:hypothetical protein
MPCALIQLLIFGKIMREVCEMKTKLIPSAIPIYIAAAVWVIFGLFGHLYEFSNILLALGLSLVAYLVAGKFLPGRKVEVEESLTTGDRAVDQRLAASLESLKRLREAAALAHSPGVAEELKRIDKQAANPLRPSRTRAPGMTKSASLWTLPAHHRQAHRPLPAVGRRRIRTHGPEGGHRHRNSLDMIALAFEKQLDKLYGDEALDITTDIQVLETMMAADGLTDAGILKSVSARAQRKRS